MTGSVWVASYVFLWIAVLVLAFTTLALLRQIGVLHARLSPLGVHFAGEGPELGSEAPHDDRFGYASAPVTVLAFTSRDCTICGSLVPGLRALDSQYDDVALHLVDHDALRTIFESFNVRSTPYFVAVDRRGVVRVRGVGNTLEQVELLIDEALKGGGEQVPHGAR